jgi:hypothetical protein
MMAINGYRRSMRQIFVKDRELKFNRLFSLSYIAVAAVLST